MECDGVVGPTLYALQCRGEVQLSNNRFIIYRGVGFLLKRVYTYML